MVNWFIEPATKGKGVMGILCVSILFGCKNWTITIVVPKLKKGSLYICMHVCLCLLFPIWSKLLKIDIFHLFVCCSTMPFKETLWKIEKTIPLYFQVRQSHSIFKLVNGYACYNELQSKFVTFFWQFKIIPSHFFSTVRVQPVFH